jgi:hypothetical protein
MVPVVSVALPSTELLRRDAITPFPLGAAV